MIIVTTTTFSINFFFNFAVTFSAIGLKCVFYSQWFRHMVFSLRVVARLTFSLLGLGYDHVDRKYFVCFLHLQDVLLMSLCALKWRRVKFI